MLKTMWKLCILQAEPEDLPYSGLLLLGTAVINFSMLFYMISLASGSYALGIWKSLILIFITAAYTRVILQIGNMSDRFIQTLTSLYTCQTIILTICIIPYVILLAFISDVDSNTSYTLGLLVCGSILVFASVWLFSVMATIFRKSLEISINASYIISIALFAILLCVFSLIS